MTRHRINAHFQFYTEVVGLVNGAERVRAMINPQYEELLGFYGKEDDALKRIRKSALTEVIGAADRDRDRVFRGLSDANRSTLNHFVPEIEAAGRRIQIVLNAYGNVVLRPMDEKTSAIYNLAAELEKNYADDLEKTGLTEWVEELRKRNVILTDLVHERYAETAGRTDTAMSEIRSGLDEAYRVLVLCVEALYVMAPTEEDRAPFAEFIKLLNAVVEHYNTVLARNRSHSTSGNGENTPADDGSNDQQPAEVTKPADSVNDAGNE